MEKAFDKIQHTFLMCVLQTVEQEGTQPNIIKAVYEMPTVNIILNGRKVTDSGKEIGLPTIPTLPVLEGLTGAIHKANGENERHTNRKEAKLSHYD